MTGRTIPCTPAQRRLWFLQQLTAESAPAYHLCAAYRVRGHVDVPALRQALRAIAARHEVLRSRVVGMDGQPHMVVETAAPDVLAVVDIGAPGATAELVAEAVDGPFDTERGPLHRARLLRRPGGDVLVLCFSHLVCDGWSFGVFVRELAEHYATAVRGKTLVMDVPFQYGDHAVRELARLAAPSIAAELDAWAAELAAAPAELTLPTDRPRPRARRYRGGQLSVRIPASVRTAIAELAREHRVTPAAAHFAAFGTLLCRWAGQEQVVLGTPVSGRGRTEQESAIGFFANTVPVRIDLSGDPTPAELLGATATELRRAIARQHLPFEELVDRLSPTRDTGRTPVFGAMLAYQSTPEPELSFGDLRATGYPLPTRTSRFDLTLDVFANREQVTAALEYDTDLFDGTTARRLADQYLAALRGLVADPDLPASALPLTSGTRAVRWPEPAAEPADTLAGLLDEQFHRTPDATAVIADEQTWTYRELDVASGAVAAALGEVGAGPDDVVAVLLPRSSAMVAALVGTVRASAAYLPLDPEDPPERLRTMLRLARPKALLADSDADAVSGDPNCLLLRVDQLPTTARVPAARVRPDNLAYVIYTSGSTGQPKGVMISHRAIANRLRWMQRQYRLTAGDRVLQKTPYTFDVSVWEFFLPLISGGAVVVAPPGAHRDPVALANVIAGNEVTVTHFVPPMLAEFLRAPTGELPSVRHIFCSGEVLPVELAADARRRFAAALHNLYGPTEAAVDVTWHECTGAAQLRTVPIGRPVAGTSVHVLDSCLNPVPPGVVGRLYLGGVQLARGYLAQPALTATSFIPDPCGPPGSRLYDTGDLVRIDGNGELEFVGRADDQVKLRGFRIELGEVVRALRAHPAVVDAVAHVHTNGDSPGRLVGYVVTEDESLTGGGAPQLRALLERTLPGYLVPAMFVRIPAVPLSGNGKLDRRALPAPRMDQVTSEFVAPSNDTERALAEIWADVLGVPVVGRRDNFFHLGGDSIRAMQVASRLAERAMSVPLSLFFTEPTLAAIAAATTVVPDRHRPAGDPCPMTVVQLAALDAQPHLLRADYDSALEPAKLARALRQLRRTQPALRLRLDPRNGQQAVAPPGGDPPRLPAPTDSEPLVVRDSGQASGEVVLAVHPAAVNEASLPAMADALDSAVRDGGGDPVRLGARIGALVVTLRALAERTPDPPHATPGPAAVATRTLPSGVHELVRSGTPTRCTAVDLFAAAAIADPPLGEPSEVGVDIEYPYDGDHHAAVIGPFDRRSRIRMAPGPIDSARLRAVKDHLRTDRGRAAPPSPVLVRVRPARQPAHGRWRHAVAAPRPAIGYAVTVDIDADGVVTVFAATAADAERIADRYVAAVGTLTKAISAGEVGAYHRADFPLMDLSDAALEQLSRTQPGLADLYPLTPIQRHMVPRLATAPMPGLYVITMTMAVEGQGFDYAAFRATWRELIRRRPTLRTCFLDVPGAGFAQAVAADPALPITLVDLRDSPSDQREARLTELEHDEREHVFDIAVAPQWRITVLRFGPDSYRIVLRFSYTLQDGWSFAVITEEWFALYDAYRGGRHPDLAPPPPLTEHLRRLATRDRAAGKAYWTDALRELPGAAMLRDARDRLTGGSDTDWPRYRSHGTRLTPVLEQRIGAVCRRHHLTPFTIMSAAWARRLARLTGRRLVAFGVVSSGRDPALPDMARQTGAINNLLPLVTTVPATGDQPLDWLRELQYRHARNREHDQVSLAELRDWFGRTGVDPLVDNYLVFESFPRKQWVDAAFDAWGPDSGETQTEHALRLLFWPSAPMAIFASHYADDLGPGRVRALLADYVSEIEELVAVLTRLGWR